MPSGCQEEGRQSAELSFQGTRKVLISFHTFQRPDKSSAEGDQPKLTASPSKPQHCLLPITSWAGPKGAQGAMTSTQPLLFSSLSSKPSPGEDEVELNCWFNEDFKFILLPVSYAIVFILGLGLNAPTLWLFLFRLRPWDATATYMFHLALSDTLYVLSLPTLVYYYAAHNHWPFGTGLCKFVRFLFYWNLYCSVLFLTCISVHRYLGICHPLRALRWGRPHFARLLCLAVWLVVAGCLVPNLFFVTTSIRGATILCHDTTRPEEFDHYVHFSSAVMGLLFGLPCLVTLVCYGLMARRLYRPLPGAAQPSSRLRSLRTIIVVLTVFAVCFVPFHITRTIYYLTRLLKADCQVLNIVNVVYKVTRPLASANSCLDPVLYLFTGDKYRRQLWQLCRGGKLQCPTAASSLALVTLPEDSSSRWALSSQYYGSPANRADTMGAKKERKGTECRAEVKGSIGYTC